MVAGRYYQHPQNDYDKNLLEEKFTNLLENVDYSFLVNYNSQNHTE